MQTEIVSAGPLALELTWDGDALWAMDLRWSRDVAQGRSTAQTAYGRDMAGRLRRYVDGEAVDWPLPPLALERVNPFQRRVLETLRAHAPHGASLTYGQLAALAGSPGAARAVGRAMATNPWSMVFP